MAYTQVANTFAFEQVAASASWVIVHSLGLDSPVIDCWIDVAGSMTKILPLSVVVTDANTITVTFSSAYAGKAHVA